MHFRTPSALTGLSTMRRRSAGAMTYNPDVPLTNSNSQPIMPLVLGSSDQESPLSPMSPQIEQHYHIYSSLGTSSGVGEDTLEPIVLSSTANNNHLPSDSFVGSSTMPSSADETSASFYNHSGISGDIDPSGNCHLASTTSNTTMSFDSGHRGLIPDIGTTSKFTHKWPRPKTMKYIDPLSKGLQYTCISVPGQNNHGAATLLEKGQGFGLSRLASWNVFKCLLIISAMTVFAYGCAGLIIAIMTWFNTWQGADVMFVADNDILILITLAGSILLFTSLIGLTGTLLNSRPVLAVYGILLWPAMLSLLAIGYTSYKRYSLSLDHKLNYNWSRYYTPVGRRVIQDSLQCCGFYSAMHEAAPSKKCYLRAALPGCKARLFDFERANLRAIWKTIFALLPLHLANIVVVLLCANHITTTFGKGIVPPQYRLCAKDVKADADKILAGTGVKTSLMREGIKHE